MYFLILDRPIHCAEQNEDLVLKINDLEREFVPFLSNDPQDNFQESSTNFFNTILNVISSCVS
jgi:subtilisin-like proprotein convertase family protein